MLHLSGRKEGCCGAIENTLAVVDPLLCLTFAEEGRIDSINLI